MNETKPHILAVDDDDSLLRLITIRLESAGYQVTACESAKLALTALESEAIDAVVTDLQMDEMDGMELFSAIQRNFEQLPVIILTAHGTIPDAVDATRKGVFDYLTKPFEPATLLDTVARAIANSTRREAQTKQEPWRQHIIGDSPHMVDLLTQAKQVANAELPVMVFGQSGTGKELLAKAIHQASPREAGPFIAVNCAAIPEALLESELFGHKKGAFTGAHQDHKGLFENAHMGTLFLDEVAEMPMAFQVKLLRAVQEKEVRPVGSHETLNVDVRIIAATHRHLNQMVADGEFREDLYYRLNVVDLNIPSLAERKEDIPYLVEHFIAKTKQKMSVPTERFSAEAMTALLNYHWPGNIRQLQNIIERILALNTSTTVQLDMVQKALRDKVESITPFGQAKEEFERRYLAQLLRMTKGNVSQAAKLAQKNRTEFYKLIEKHGMQAESFRD